MKDSSKDSQQQVTCPVCSSRSDLRIELPAPFIRQSLGKYYGAEVPDQVEITDYKLFCCRKCTLQFAMPMVPGEPSFYEWITLNPHYYPADRWEWGEVRKWLSLQAGPLRLLEVGCGSGEFIQSLQSLGHVTSVGLDTTPGSVAACREKGLEVYAMSLEQIHIPSHEISHGFDVVVSFHCLEHIPDPIGFLRNMLKLLNPKGKIFISTPYSPMSFEPIWFDPLNHPPHHLSRWNEVSIAELAFQAGLSHSLRMPLALSLMDRVFESLDLAIHGPHNSRPKHNLASTVLLQPVLFAKAVLAQLARDKVNSFPAANVVLTEFGR